ncbi:dihydrofolate reductase family protein [Arthrobacter sp. AOP36-A1-22]|uniref:dihydrofolate reductase family protein n=1 Tax=Arthrobacter sp. AOP36-A1-22 TaxID=3457684 RepID=UPI00264E19F1|nr:dihydrofolate reductase family protein [Micrococcaceae bacterium]MDN5879776.1 dihydrofolate reductase family protein [Micrococcaceae bacterium]MDN5905292.1 dihydrofolate reductase family protein [Micrococcaceae bacterium]
MVQQLIPPRRDDGSPDLTDEQLLELYAPQDRALVRFNFVASADGAATTGGTSGGLGTDADQRLFALQRRHADVILVGAGTIRAEGYAGKLLDAEAQAWRRDRGLPSHPAIAVVSGSLALDPESDFFTSAPVPVLVFTTGPADPARREAISRVAEVITAGADDVDPRQVLAGLGGRGHRMVHAEGGPTLFASFQRADAVDSLCLTVSPVLAGGEGQRIATGPTSGNQPVRLALLLEEAGALFTEYRRAPAHDSE